MHGLKKGRHVDWVGHRRGLKMAGMLTHPFRPARRFAAEPIVPGAVPRAVPGEYDTRDKWSADFVRSLGDGRYFTGEEDDGRPSFSRGAPGLLDSQPAATNTQRFALHNRYTKPVYVCKAMHA